MNIVIGIIGWAFNLIAWLIPSPREYFKEILAKKGRNKPFTYKNDIFAKDTIKYRFMNTLHDLNDIYEDAIFKSIIDDKHEGNNVEYGIKRPFSYDTFTSETFHKPEVLRSKLSQSDASLLDRFYDDTCQNYLEEGNKKFITEAPFIDVEHHFYYYILDKYYALDDKIQVEMASVAGEKINDPYKRKKARSIINDIKLGTEDKREFSRILRCLNDVEDYFDATSTQEKKNILIDVIKMSLNANSYDLSQLNGRVGHILDPKKCKCGDIEDFVNYIMLGLKKKIELNYLVDNSGVEFVSDLCLARILLSESVEKVIFHVNVLPIFVSDVVEDDYNFMIQVIESQLDEKMKIYREGLERIKEMFNPSNPKAEIVPSFFWNMPTPYREVKNELKPDIFSANNSLLIVKGDLNYRRLVEDKNWKYSKRLETLTDYIKCPALVIRCFKSDLVLDYKWKDYNKNNKTDSDWRSCGEYGVVRFLRGSCH